MFRRSLLTLMTLFALTLGAASVAAQDEPIVWQPGVFTDPAWLKIDYQRVRVEIDNQIATTNVDMQFTNEGEALAEGTFIFPLPTGATVDELIMFIDGVAIESKILPADEARGIYDEIVRQYRDPALLEYIGDSAIQANVFPIPPGDSRRIQISYSTVLEVDNGLVHYIFPMNSNTLTPRRIGEMSVSVDVTSNDAISNIYSPSHNIAISRDLDSDKAFRAGFETLDFAPGDDFSLFYGVAGDTISVNLLSYKESANEDGFFMLLVQPPLSVPDEMAIPKDVFIVLDQSGSMEGEKWNQARNASAYVLENLNPQDRFNVIAFSTGMRMYANGMQGPGMADDAIDWVMGMEANGGTDINLALTTALDNADRERQTTIIFMTDGVATEGEIDRERILDNLEDAAKGNTRIFSFGVGDDVDTFLLDEIVQGHHGAGSYVRPSERIDEEVASLYNKISAPVLIDTALDFDDARVELLYPAQLPDLFAGEQLTLVGRYRDEAEDFTLRLSGTVNGDATSFVYDGLDLRANAGGEAFIARLWATRRIGDLLNTIRLRGENQELVDSVVDLSVRYGIITPYTSFLIEEDDILTQTGRDRAAQEFAETEAQALNRNDVGSVAVDAADEIAGLNSASAPALAPTSGFFANEAPADFDAEGDDNRDGTGAGGQAGGERGQFNAINTINSKTFVNIDNVWTDTTFDPDNMETNQVVFLSDEYFDLLDEVPEVSDYFAQGENVIVVIEGVAYEVIPA